MPHVRQGQAWRLTRAAGNHRDYGVDVIMSCGEEMFGSVRHIPVKAYIQHAPRIQEKKESII